MPTRLCAKNLLIADLDFSGGLRRDRSRSPEGSSQRICFPPGRRGYRCGIGCAPRAAAATSAARSSPSTEAVPAAGLRACGRPGMGLEGIGSGTRETEREVAARQDFAIAGPNWCLRLEAERVLIERDRLGFTVRYRYITAAIALLPSPPPARCLRRCDPVHEQPGASGVSAFACCMVARLSQITMSPRSHRWPVLIERLDSVPISSSAGGSLWARSSPRTWTFRFGSCRAAQAIGLGVPAARGGRRQEAIGLVGSARRHRGFCPCEANRIVTFKLSLAMRAFI